MKLFHGMILCLALCVLSASDVRAELINGVEVEWKSSEYTADWTFLASYLVDGSGLAGQGHALANQDVNGFSNSWLTQLGDTDWRIIFDLGAVYKLTSMHIWNFNYAGQTGSGAREVAISASLDNASWSSPWNAVFDKATGLAGYTGFSLDDPALPLARYIQFDIQSNYGTKFYNAYNLAGLSEVRFNGTPVPEPSSLLLLGTGLTGLALAWRSRRDS